MLSKYAYVLFDPGVTHSLISTNFIRRNSEILPAPLESDLGVSTTNGDIIIVDSIYKSCILSIANKEMVVDLLVLELRDFDIILGMDWLAAYYAPIDCFKKIVTYFRSARI